MHTYLQIPKHAKLIMFYLNTFSLPQISMNVTVTMVIVNRHASMKMEATPAPVELDIHKMVFMVAQVIFFV